ncbi:MAG: hypothetical protein CRU78_18870, partial [Candidatus Accumulibacter phosphatis]|nr:hypothetical protein [Candidatus Accumulibacter phosphatis]
MSVEPSSARPAQKAALACDFRTFCLSFVLDTKSAALDFESWRVDVRGCGSRSSARARECKTNRIGVKTVQDRLENHWHHLPASEVIELLDAKAGGGLDQLEVAGRQERFGANALTPAKGKSPLQRFLQQFNQALVYILVAAIMVKLALGGYVDAAVIFAVVLLNAVLGFAQENKALNALAALSRALTAEATVVRAGNKQRINARDLVPGDLVMLVSGDKVPADLRLLQVRDLQVDESALTGESVPVAKQAGELAPDAALADRRNMAYTSTLVTYGTATGVVTAIGDGT